MKNVRLFLLITAITAIATLRVSALMPPKMNDEFTLNVDYGKTLEQQINDGKYNWKSNDINAKNFPIFREAAEKKEEIFCRLFNRDRTSTEDVIKIMSRSGYRPATLVELLAMAVAYPNSPLPDLKREILIVALGSVWQNADGQRKAPHLRVGGAERTLSIIDLGGNWDSRSFFLGVRLSSQTTQEFVLTVDYAKKLEQLIAEGKFFRTLDQITSKNFPVSSEMTGKKVTIACKLFYFGYRIYGEDVIDEMAKQGYRPATLTELLAFEITYPDFQTRFMISAAWGPRDSYHYGVLALGSTYHWHPGSTFAPVLDQDEAHRQLWLLRFDDYLANAYFLGVRSTGNVTNKTISKTVDNTADNTADKTFGKTANKTAANEEVNKPVDKTTNEMADEFTLTVDYGKSLEQQIAAGNYGYSDSIITSKNFAIPAKIRERKEVIYAKLFSANHLDGIEDIATGMSKVGYRPATIFELLALGAAYPDLQRRFSLLALGSIWNGPANYHSAPSLCVPGNGRVLMLEWIDFGWNIKHRFLGVRK